MQFHLTQEQVPQEIQWLSELVGMEHFLQILDTAGGECIYFPKRETLERPLRLEPAAALPEIRRYRPLHPQHPEGGPAAQLKPRRKGKHPLRSRPGVSLPQSNPAGDGGLPLRPSSSVQKEEGLREEHGSARQIARGPLCGASRRFRRNARDRKGRC